MQRECEPMDTKIQYFPKPGKQNTNAVVNLAINRAVRRRIKNIVVASNTGKTGLLVAERAAKRGIGTVVVTSAHGFSEKGKWDMEEAYMRKFKSMNVKIVSATHALSGVERSFTKKFGGASRVESVVEALRSLFGHGMKVCIEITIMAADSGAIPCKEETEIIAIAGSDEGADTAVVVRPSHANSFFDIQIREIIAMPRTR